MTLIVVKNDMTVLVDSYVGNNEYATTCEKFFDIGAYIGLGAGNAAEVERVIDEVASKGLESVERAFSCDSNTEVLIIEKATRLMHVLRSKKGSRFCRVYNNNNRLGFIEIFGSGYYHFVAYLQEHGDVDKAFQLTLDHCPTVAHPMHVLNAAERT